MVKQEDWFKIKKYPHIGNPIVIKDYNRVKSYVNNSQKISKHSFLPFIHKTILKRKFRADKNHPKKNPSGKRCRVRNKPKDRNIFFASHLDAMIFSKYNTVIAKAYEDYIETKPYNESIVAYRKIPIIKGENGNRCNIDFAKSAFEFIKANQDKELSVIVADITSFFDNLDHKILKKNWARVLLDTSLPPDHYNLFKALTRIKYVESQHLFDANNHRMIVKRGVPNSSSLKEYVPKRINKQKYFKEKDAVAYCCKEEFLKNNLNLIVSKNNKTGIPQGSPISATLANIYMLDFDEIIFTNISCKGGFYQRYSDDLIIVLERKYEDNFIKLLQSTISGNSVKLTIESKKTKLYHFQRNNEILQCLHVSESTEETNSIRALEYLGFSFDGQRVLIKNAGFSKFYRSMKGSFNRASSYALHSKNPDKSLFKSRLYERFTHKGAKRKLIHHPSAHDSKVYYETKKYNWGNYLSYVYKANDSMKMFNGSNAIKKQSRKLWRKFHSLMKLHEKRLGS
ncbi:MAG: reverse transcriptase domain-containing protein [Chitinophagales bacterium]